MKTSWVLTEDDKNKVASAKRSHSGDHVSTVSDINIKTETAEPDPVIEHNQTTPIKQRRPSSPMSLSQLKSSSVSSQFFQPDPHNIYQGLSRHYPPQYPGLYGAVPPGHSYNYNVGMNIPSVSGAGMFPCSAPNINTMHVSLSTPADGLSLTIETGHGSHVPGPSSEPGPSNLLSPRPNIFTKQETATSPGPCDTWHNNMMDSNKKSRRHHQQSRTIFRCVSGIF